MTEGFEQMLVHGGLIALQSVVVLVGLLIVVAFLLLFDRKVWAAVQLRKGPNVVGPFGLFQSFADLLKFVLKEPVIPAGANRILFLLAPLITGVLSLAAWAVIPFDRGWVVADINVGILYLFAISSLSVYGVIMGGWASNSKYAFLGALALCSANGLLRSIDRFCIGLRASMGRLAEFVRCGRGAERALWFAALALYQPATLPDVCRIFHLRACGDEPSAFRFA